MTLPSSPAGSPATPASSPDAADPSMEEILASIRRILNEDEPAAGATSQDPPDDDDVLVLDRSMLVAAPDSSAAPPPEQPEAPATLSGEELKSPEITPDDAANPGDAAADLASELSAAHTVDSVDPPSEPPHVTTNSPDPPIASPPPSFGAPLTPEGNEELGQSLIGPATAAAAASSVDGLIRTLVASRATQTHRGGPTIEDLVREEVRPLLKEWLDQNLPALVDRLVRAEIERVVGRMLP